MKSALLGALCVVVLCIILSLGLWPFHDPPNQVRWMQSSDGIEFGRYGTVLGSGELAGSQTEGDSIEIWVQPDHWLGSATLLALYQPQKSVLFTLNQSLTDLELQIESGSSKTHFYVGEALAPALQQKKAVFITVTSGQAGTSVYRDGVLIMTAPRFSIPPEAFAGRPILGDRPGQPDSFRGQIRGLAIYDRELNAAQVLRHYRSWTGNGAPEIAPEERNIALYLFNEETGRVIHNHVSGGVDLDIPKRYSVVDKVALEPFWREFDFSESYWSGNLKNIVGFLPVGFCFYAWILAVRPGGRPVLLTVVVGFLISLTIEVLQIFLPTRDSGTTDLFTNLLGTYLGVLCYREIYPMIVKRFPILGFMQATEPQPAASSKHPTHCSS